MIKHEDDNYKVTVNNIVLVKTFVIDIIITIIIILLFA